MFFDGARAQPEDCGNLRVAFAFNDPSEDFSFAQAQRMESEERQGLGGRLGERARAEAVLGGMEIVLSYLQSAPRAIRSNIYRVRQWRRTSGEVRRRGHLWARRVLIITRNGPSQ
ncbi:MAG: hypothetical protein QOE26_1083 [Verrucomicrobiota bacterium]|jgi:hypothetical protein